jgi:hypothetical protein
MKIKKMGEVFEYAVILSLIVLNACLDFGVGNSQICNLYIVKLYLQR